MALIPTERLANWEAGVTIGVIGGIPTGRPVFDDDGSGVTESMTLIDDTGATNVTAAIQAAITACPAGERVVMPPGTFQFTSLTPKTGTSFCGSGSDPDDAPTIMDCRGGGIAFDSDPNWPEPFNSISDVASGLTAGSTSVVVTDVSGGLTPFSAGRMAQIRWANDPDLPVINTLGEESTRRFDCWVTNVAGSTLTITPPLPATFPNVGTAFIVQTQLSFGNGLGFEDFIMDGTLSGGSMVSGVKLGVCHNSWIKNVRVIEANNYPLWIYDCTHVEITECWIEPGGGGPNHAGMLTNISSGLYVYDNIIEDNQPGIEINQGVAGSVYAYNLIICAIFGIDTNHGPHNSYNLFEGNVVTDFMSDGYFGSESEGTIFRNWILARNPATADLLWTVALKRFSRNFSVVGNIMQSPGLSYSNNGLSLGQPNLGNSSSFGTVEPSMGDWWIDLVDETVTTPYHGSLTTRTDDDHGLFTIDEGTAANFIGDTRGDNIIILHPDGSVAHPRTYVMSVAGSVLTLDSTNGGTGQLDTLPPLNSESYVWAGPGGFQELDLDVENTLLLKANFYYFTNDIPAGENPSPDTVPNSLYLDSAPSWFTGFTFPPFDSSSPGAITYARIPAGQRYLDSLPPAAPEILNNPIQTAFLSEAWSLQIETDIPATEGYSADDLPMWMTLDEDTGLITGDPVEGVFEFTLHATNEVGTGDLPVTLTVRETRRAAITAVTRGIRHSLTKQGPFIVLAES